MRQGIFPLETNLKEQSDVCSFSLYNAYYAACTPSEAQACFDSIPFNETFRTQTISTLRQLISLYSFTDIAQNSGEPYNVQVKNKKKIRENNRKGRLERWS